MLKNGCFLIVVLEKTLESPLDGKEITSILAWEIPWTEEPGGLQSMGLQKVGKLQPLPSLSATP